jgi:hypothetical protein
VYGYPGLTTEAAGGRGKSARGLAQSKTLARDEGVSRKAGSVWVRAVALWVGIGSLNGSGLLFGADEERPNGSYSW